jgi:hypothetical protein
MANLNTQYRRRLDKPDFASYVKPYLEEMRAKYGWHDFNVSLEYFQQIHQAIFGMSEQGASADVYECASDPVALGD